MYIYIHILNFYRERCKAIQGISRTSFNFFLNKTGNMLTKAIILE